MNIAKMLLAYLRLASTDHNLALYGYKNLQEEDSYRVSLGIPSIFD